MQRINNTVLKQSVFSLLFLFCGLFFFPQVVGAGELKFHALYVGSGDCLIIESNNHYMLVDGGFQQTSEHVIEYLDSLEIPDNQFDYVIATHPDTDHIGGIPYIYEKYGAKQVIYSPCTKSTTTYTEFIASTKEHKFPLRTPVEGEKWTLGDATVEVIYDGSQGTTYNECSIVLRVSCDGKSILLTGDLPAIMEHSLIQQGYNFRADILKVAHHGAGSSTCMDFLDAVKPTHAVISSSAEPTAKLPRDSLLIRLAKRFVKTYRTTDGNVLVSIIDGVIQTSHKENNGFYSITKGTITLSKNITYATGSSLKPKVTLTVNGKTVPKDQYKVSYSSNKYPGTATVTVKGRNIKYVGTLKTKFLILPAKEKLKVSLSGLTKIRLSWDSQKNISGYTVVYSKDKKFLSDLHYIQITSPSTLKRTVSHLPYGTTYYFRMRAYISKLGYGKWSKTHSIKTAKDPTPVRENIRLVKFLSSTNRIKIKWKKYKKDQATGFIIEYSLKKKFNKDVRKVKIKKATVHTATLSKIQKGKTYYIRVRGYNKYKKGPWSKTKRIKIKK
ncbi:MAG: MBL fold metallo-hydrolase [Eubacterium sp.]|nr:MBL fold metallo-hydrolase [Eubacterium sp.]